MSAIVIAREPLAGLLDSGLEALLREHWEEVAHNRDAIALDPDWPGYLEDERQGRFITWSARRDGDLVGYNAFYVMRHRHYKGDVFAVNDVIFLTKEERGATGIALIIEVEKALRAMGASKVFYHAKSDALLGEYGDSLQTISDIHEVEEITGQDIPDSMFGTDLTLGNVLQVLGYGHTENQFGKLLKEPA